MIIVTIVRIAGMRIRGSGSVDIVWLFYWQQQECSIAVLMMSVSAFRTLFVPSPANLPPPSEKGRRFMRRRPDPDLYDTHGTNGLPQIPSATLTGMATLVRGDRDSGEMADPDQQSRRGHDRSTTASAANTSARDAELGLPMESGLLHTRSETYNAKQSSSSATKWWKFLQPQISRTASTVRTGYWDIMTLFHTTRTESVIQSMDRSNGQL